MMNIRAMISRRVLSFLATTMFLLAFTCLQRFSAQAQWSTNGTNIYTNTGNVGVGTDSPVARFQIVSDSSAYNNANIATFSFGNATTPGKKVYAGYDTSIDAGFFQSIYYGNGYKNLVLNPAGGNVGVGTTAPLARFEIVNTTGGYTTSNYFQIIGTTADNNNYPGISLKGGNLASEYPFLQLGNGGLALTISSGRNGTSYPNRVQLALSANSSGAGYAGFQIYNGSITKDLLTVKDSGNVGIGTAMPQALMDLNRAFSDTSGSGFSLGFSQGGGIYHGWRMNTSGLLILDSYNTNVTNTWNPSLAITKGGNVGIGTATPNSLYTLDVTGQINASQGLCINGLCKNSWSDITGSSQWTTSSSNIYYGTGNVGIGTTAPTARLSITDGAAPYAAAATDLLQLRRGTTNSTANDGVSLTLANNSNGFRIRYGGTSDRLGFVDGGSVEVLSLVNGGNVGIGTATPASKLDVAGSINASENINATGNITATGRIEAKYQDVAEWVPSRQNLAPGTVVILDPERTNQVIASIDSYDTRVAGVISEQPGVLLGEGGEGKVKVATTGRVRVKVDASRGPIKIGDLLVASGEEGVAMRSEPINVGGVWLHRPGTIIGKALEPLEKGKGEILVLLSLQ